jgi:hypothetical protein
VALTIERDRVRGKADTASAGDIVKRQELMAELGAGALEHGQGDDILSAYQSRVLVAAVR